MLRDGLGSISSALLKPQQRLYIATHHLLPKCHHQLPPPTSLAKYLRWLDRQVQPATCNQVLQSCLKLPKDTPIPLFHAPVVEGGLGVPLHEHVVAPKHLSRSDVSLDPVIAQYQPAPTRPCRCARLAWMVSWWLHLVTWRRPWWWMAVASSAHR